MPSCSGSSSFRATRSRSPGRSRATTPDGPITVEAKGSLTAPFDIVPGLQIYDAVGRRSRRRRISLGLTGEGTINVTGAAGGLGVGEKLAYDNPKNWSLTADGQGSATWEPVSGLKLTPSRRPRLDLGEGRQVRLLARGHPVRSLDADELDLGLEPRS